jgi:cobalt transporter subunit CbtA
MSVFRSIVFVAALAGLVGGGFAFALHMIGTARIIERAEVYEKAADDAAAAATHDTASHDATTHDHGATAMAAHEEAATEWEPEDGLERALYTALADVLTGIGFALLLAAGFAIWGHAVDWRVGLFWGLAGFATFTIAPGIGLPPMVPGTEGAPLLARQVWWVATAAATGGGLALLFLSRRAALAVAGIVLLVLPHLIGAPQPDEFKSAAPPALAHEFIVAAMVTSLLFWLALGSLTGALFGRFQRS